jgi:DHA1 family inner membrane transport protein
MSADPEVSASVPVAASAGATSCSCATLAIRYAAVFLVLFLVGTETFMVSPLLPAFVHSFAVTERTAAMLANAYVLTYAFVAPAAAIITDRYRRGVSILAGTAIFAAANLLAMLAPAFLILALARTLAGIGAAVAGPAIWAYVADTSSPSVRSRAIGTGMAAFSLGQVVGVPTASLIAALVTWRGAFAAVGVLTLTTLTWLYGTLRHAPAHHDSGLPRPDPAQVFAVWRLEIPARALAVTFLFHAANLGSYVYISTVLYHRFTLPLSSLGLIGVLVGVGSVLGAIAAGRIGDGARARNYTDASRLPLWALMLTAGILAVVFSPSLWFAIAGVLLWFAASGAFVTDQQTLLSNAVPALRASSSSWNTATMHIGTAMGVWAIGSLPSIPAGIAAVTILGGGSAALAGLTLDARLRRHRLRSRSSVEGMPKSG